MTLVGDGAARRRRRAQAPSSSPPPPIGSRVGVTAEDAGRRRDRRRGLGGIIRAAARASDPRAAAGVTPSRVTACGDGAVPLCSRPQPRCSSLSPSSPRRREEGCLQSKTRRLHSDYIVVARRTGARGPAREQDAAPSLSSQACVAPPHHTQPEQPIEPCCVQARGDDFSHRSWHASLASRSRSPPSQWAGHETDQRLNKLCSGRRSDQQGPSPPLSARPFNAKHRHRKLSRNLFVPPSLFHFC